MIDPEICTYDTSIEVCDSEHGDPITIHASNDPERASIRLNREDADVYVSRAELPALIAALTQVSER